MKTDDQILEFLEWFGLLDEFIGEKELSGISPGEYISNFQLTPYLEDFCKNKTN